MRTLALILAAVLGSSGCEYYLLHYSDCRYYDGPRFDRTVLNRSVLNQVYFDQIWVSFDNDSHIDSIDYWLEFDGGLPPGITYSQTGRQVLLEGTATSLGFYSFSITASVHYRIHGRSYYGYSREYCTYRSTQNYQLTVVPER